MKLIVGLGNPGEEYKNTRHNIGFQVLDSFAHSQFWEFKKEAKLKAKLIKDNFTYKPIDFFTAPLINGKKEPPAEEEAAELYQEQSTKIVLAKPTTYMNLSGSAVQKVSAYFKIPVQDILVVHDDVALDFGTVRVSYNRGAGGQHGVEDIMEKLGNKKSFYRLRIGVGPDPGGDRRADFVLSKFNMDERADLARVRDLGMSAIKDWLVMFNDPSTLGLEQAEISKLQERVIQKYNSK